MKNKTDKITYIFIFIAIILAFSSLTLLERQYASDDFLYLHILRDFIFVTVCAVVIRYFIVKNDRENRHNLEKLKNNNLEIRESKERYDIVAKATSDTIWDWKIQENEFTWNKGIQGVYGYKRDEVGQNSKWWFDRIHPEDSIRMSVKLYAFLEQKTQKWQDEYRFKCRDGSYKYVLDRGFLVFNEKGTPIRMIGAMQDITKQKKEEQRLKLLETVITNTKDAVVITDANNAVLAIPEIVFVNQAFTNMSGYDYEDVIGKSPLIFFGKRTDPAEIARLTHCIHQKQECETELICYKKNGTEYWVRFSMVPVFNSEKEHTHWISIQRDVTERKQQEKEREQLINELTQNNKDLRQFSYITSHNLRAPLSNLIGLLQLLEEIPLENDELQQIMEGFSKSTYLLNETISDLGKVVIIRDNPSIEKQHIPIRESIDNVMDQIQIMITANNLQVDYDIAASDVYSNKAYFESIMLNLLTNAIKYKSESRPLRISISVTEDDDFTILRFSDNGIGIDLHKFREKVFGLYQRFHNYPDSKGLGLYLVKSQIESMGGEISIESEVDYGTTFIVKFRKEK
ncbi:PAS domain-containing sensor histidine kinase [Flavobacterium magnum]|uniref:histidine kinase n=1 Tax=Flavobacterium magnum TaxID=2162713 RepID=A0A2S0RFM7_9FLAO|nr:PAS domain-containing sensor histidine kinase [Flavobacterium magnum]AWA30048.1 PAS domain-containing sensor histidine kinase [Flavobacterium magnum]